LHVKGSNNDDVWNEEGVSIRIVIIITLVETIYAICFCGFSVDLYLHCHPIQYKRLRNANQVLREKELASSEISRQREELIQKNRSITDSINYAKRIQLAMMPTSKHFRRLFPESFVYYKPKGYCKRRFLLGKLQKNDKVFFAVIDCTGHGVPGCIYVDYRV
jgi:hypothetical protein